MKSHGKYIEDRGGTHSSKASAPHRIGDGTHAAMQPAELLAGLPKRPSLADVLPEKLAPLFLAYLRAPLATHVIMSAAQARLLNLTLRIAGASSAFYSERLPRLARESEEPFEILDGLPLLHRGELEAAGGSIRSAFATFAFCSYTSGTTSLNPLVIERSVEEQNYLSQFFKELHRLGDAPQEPRLVLSLATWLHGHQIQLPGTALTFPVALSNEASYVKAASLLERTFKIGGAERHITGISGTLGDLMSLSAYLDNTGRVRGRVNLLQTFGHYVTEYCRRWLESFWGTRPDDLFSFTELFFTANSCSNCHLYHFDPFGIADVIAFERDEPVREGRGRLVVTGLYPFTQMVPLIRYLTGDLVEVRAVDCAAGRLGYRLLGRTGSALDLSGEGHGFLSGAEIAEVLDPIADVNRPPHSAAPPLLKEAGGMPRFQAGCDVKGRPTLTVELRYLPLLFPDRAESLVAEIRGKLAERCPFLSTQLVETLDIKLVGPGTLQGEARYRP